MGRKTSDEKEGNGRIKILQASAEIFAEKGFDGARVDEIAKRAGVNKALIYYHFESKEKILEELFKQYIDDVMARKQNFVKAIDFSDETKFEDYVEKNLRFMKENDTEILKIGIVEALKNNESLFKMMDLMLKNTSSIWEDAGMEIEYEKNNNFLVNAFFFGMAPVILYIILGEKWAEYYKIDKEELYKLFISNFNESYVKKSMALVVSKKNEQ